jgi:hypothetical protein
MATVQRRGCVVTIEYGEYGYGEYKVAERNDTYHQICFCEGDMSSTDLKECARSNCNVGRFHTRCFKSATVRIS